MQGLKLMWHFLLPMHLRCRALVLLASRLMHGDKLQPHMFWSSAWHWEAYTGAHYSTRCADRRQEL